MAAVALASAALCDRKEKNHGKSPEKAADSKLHVKIPEPTPDSLAAPAQDPPAAAPKSPKAKSASPKPKKEFKSKTLSKKSLNTKPVPKDIIDGKVDVSKLIGRFDSSKIAASKPEPQPEPQQEPQPEPQPEPVHQDPFAVIKAKRDRFHMINWETVGQKE